MTILVVVIVAALLIVLIAIPIGKREQVDRLLTELDRDEDSDDLEKAEREVRDLDVMAKPEDAERLLPDWGPGAPRKRPR
jgi:hypothetical protein